MKRKGRSTKEKRRRRTGSKGVSRLALQTQTCQNKWTYTRIAIEWKGTGKDEWKKRDPRNSTERCRHKLAKTATPTYNQKENQKIQTCQRKETNWTMVQEKSIFLIRTPDQKNYIHDELENLKPWFEIIHYRLSIVHWSDHLERWTYIVLHPSRLSITDAVCSWNFNLYPKCLEISTHAGPNS